MKYQDTITNQKLRINVIGPAELNPDVRIEVLKNKYENHRVDGPAVIVSSHIPYEHKYEYYMNGHEHRVDGPAEVRPLSEPFYFYVDDVLIAKFYPQSGKIKKGYDVV